MPKKLTKSSYQSLVDDISAIYENAQRETAFAVNQILVRAYWDIGKRIVTVEQKGQQRAPLGSRLLERLSTDLSRKYSQGFSARNLLNMRQFFLAYPVSQTSAKLEWSHYQILSTIKSNELRTLYEDKAIDQGLSARDLKATLKEDRVPLLRSQLSAISVKSQSTKKLTAKRGRLNLAKLIDTTDIHCPQSVLEADVGFYHTVGVSLRSLDDPQPGQLIEVTPTAKGLPAKGHHARSTDAMLSQRFTYQAYVREVIDGDTLQVKIDFGTVGKVHPRLRLRDINTPEIDTPKGKEAKRFVQSRLSPAPFIIMKTHYIEAHNRYVADVWYLPGERDPHKTAAEGIYLNQELVDEGLAVVV